tara:strand:+ start:76 stop:327 length:252 start_codon:yes stop_codon:yes gene_type:complete
MIFLFSIYCCSFTVLAAEIAPGGSQSLSTNPLRPQAWGTSQRRLKEDDIAHGLQSHLKKSYLAGQHYIVPIDGILGMYNMGFV